MDWRAVRDAALPLLACAAWAFAGYTYARFSAEECPYANAVVVDDAGQVYVP
jgi:hypothetical protein